MRKPLPETEKRVGGRLRKQGPPALPRHPEAGDVHPLISDLFCAPPLSLLIPIAMMSSTQRSPVVSCSLVSKTLMSCRNSFTFIKFSVAIANPVAHTGFLLPTVRWVRSASARSGCSSSLKQNGLAVPGFPETVGPFSRSPLCDATSGRRGLMDVSRTPPLFPLDRSRPARH